MLICGGVIQRFLINWRKETRMLKGAAMSNPIQSMPTPTGEITMSNPSPPSSMPVGDFQAPPSAPSTPETGVETKNWESRFGELLKERDHLREELDKVKRERDQYLKSLYYFLRKEPQIDFDRATAFAHIDDKPAIEEMIADFERAPGK